MNLFITGVSSGLGLALSEYYLNRGDRVYGISRRVPTRLMEREGFHFHQCDLTRSEQIEAHVAPFFEAVEQFDLVILNAGILGEIEDMRETTVEELKYIMQINVWSNKLLLDTLFEETKLTQVVAISSGAAVNGSRGWNGYSISKAALNMLIKLYAAEEEQTHFTALAPGLVHTPMLDHILLEADAVTFPSVERLRQSDLNGEVLSAEAAAQKLAELFDALKGFESGSFIDVRQIVDE